MQDVEAEGRELGVQAGPLPEWVVERLTVEHDERDAA